MSGSLRLCGAVCLVVATADAHARTGNAREGSTAASGATPVIEVLHGFSDPPTWPASEVLPLPDGTIYGTTSLGGGGGGTIYRRNTDGSLTLLHSFNDYGGIAPGPRLTLFQDFIYFAAQRGPWDAGMIYRMHVATSQLTLLHTFRGDFAGGSPADGLAVASDGFLYGVAARGGSSDRGLVYRLDPASGVVTPFHNFFGFGEGRMPLAAPVQASDGFLYGTTHSGGAADRGTVYRLDPVSGVLTTLHSFTSTAPGPGEPRGALIQAADGFLYGTAGTGGAFGRGAVFRVDIATGLVTVVNSFTPALVGTFSAPTARLVEASDNMLYGLATFGGTAGGGVIYRINPATNAITPAYEFPAPGAGGSSQQLALARGSDGLLYGVTGRTGDAPDSGGRIFRFNPADGAVTLVHRFTYAAPGGSIPHVGLTQGSNGLLYGATEHCGLQCNGTLFRSTLAGAVTTLHAFDTSLGVSNGRTPAGSLTEHSDGSYYGLTEGGGPEDAGTVFRLNTDGTVTIVYSFRWFDRENGSRPAGRLLKASDGFFYGVTGEGGTFDRGVIFQLDPASGSFTPVHSFSTASGSPRNGLIEANGFLYGTSGDMIYRLHAASGAFTVAYAFGAEPAAGFWPLSPVTAAPDGYLYGTTRLGGAADNGAFYRLNPATGAATAIAAFGTEALPGLHAASELVVRAGVLYGATAAGGAHDRGTLFSFDPATGTLAVYSLDASVGRYPLGRLTLGANGDIYGVASREGPLGGGTIFRMRFPDVTAPVITITSPAAATYAPRETVFASYTCTDAQSGVASCAGSVANGSAIDTTTLGAKVFTVAATDNAGNTTSRQVSYTVAKAATVTTLVAAPNPSSALEVVRLTARVSGAANVSPTGFVEFWDGGTVLGTAEINGFQTATLGTTALRAGAHSLRATYLGNASFTGSTSATVGHTAHPLATSTITALLVLPTPSAAGSPASLVAIVAPLGGTAVPGGRVEFFDGDRSLGTAPVLPSSGYQVATLTTSGLAAGVRTLRAWYGGDGVFAGSYSPTMFHTVAAGTPPLATTTTITTTPNPSATGQTFSVTIEVRSPAGVPAGSVFFVLNGSFAGSLWLTPSGGVGRVTMTMTGGLPRGVYVMSAVYVGWGQFAASSSQNTYHCVACSLGPAVQSLPPVR